MLESRLDDGRGPGILLRCNDRGLVEGLILRLRVRGLGLMGGLGGVGAGVGRALG